MDRFRSLVSRSLRPIEVLSNITAEAASSCKVYQDETHRDVPVKAFRNLGSGEDDELINAYAYFHKMVEQEGGAVRNATLAGVE
ncbi:MAG: hypothetical protein Q9209_001548 [Squamulea sp. 1 TL-2023]